MITALLTALQNTSVLEWAANLVTLVSVVLAARNRLLTWPIGIASCLLFGWLFMDAKLYAEAALQVFFIATSAWGWWHWSAQQGKPAAPISRVAWHLAALGVVVAVAAGVAYAWGLQRWTDAASPGLDSQVLMLSMLGQWWMMQRKLDCWWVWLLVNTIAVPLYFSRELYVSSAFYAAYWVTAGVAFVRWRADLRAQASASA
jgi:nicotinamide mononucleotide transporter